MEAEQNVYEKVLTHTNSSMLYCICVCREEREINFEIHTLYIVTKYDDDEGARKGLQMRIFSVTSSSLRSGIEI